MTIDQAEDSIRTIQSNHSFNDLYKLGATQRRDHLMQKLAPGTEGTITLAGALESLEKPVAGLVRLTQATMMPALLEVPIPVRFIFVLFIPQPSFTMDCHEIGRAFSTLMNNKVINLATLWAEAVVLWWAMMSEASSNPLTKTHIVFIILP